jgi:hypothetical protein
VDKEGSEVFDDEDGTPGDLGTCGHVVSDIEGQRWGRARTQVFNVDSALIPDACVVDCHVCTIGNCRAIAAFCDPQTVDRELGGFGNFLVDLRDCGI